MFINSIARPPCVFPPKKNPVGCVYHPYVDSPRFLGRRCTYMMRYMWSFRCALQLLACGFCKVPTARCFSECPLVVTAPQHGPYNPQTGAALLFAAWGNITKLMSVFSSQNVTGSNAQTNLDTLYTGWTRLPHMPVPSCDLQQAHTVTCPRVDMQRGHRRHLPDLSIPRLHICGIWTIFT